MQKQRREWWAIHWLNRKLHSPEWSSHKLSESMVWCHCKQDKFPSKIYYHKCYVYITQEQWFHASGILYSFWGTTVKGRCRELETVQRLVIGRIEVFENMAQEGQMKEVNLFSLQKRRLRRDVIAIFSHLKGQEDYDQLLSSFPKRKRRKISFSPSKADLKGLVRMLLDYQCS